MAERVFTVTELHKPGGSATSPHAKFTWTAAEHSLPVKPYNFGVELRTVREDYPGATEPVEQVLGWNFKPFTVAGMWDDRYMGTGRAYDTYVNFERLAQRGTLVRVEFEQVSVVGLIKNVEFSYKLESMIGYQFEVSPHFRQASDAANTFARSVVSGSLALPSDMVSEVAALGAAAGVLQSEAPSIQVAGGLVAGAATALDELSVSIEDVTAELSQRVAKAKAPIDGLRRVASGMASVEAKAAAAFTAVASARSDLDMAWDSAVAILDFDVWIKGIGSTARLALLAAFSARQAIAGRADPRPAALYRPSSGESLYAVSQRFYGTPFQWRLIAERNGLTELTLNGTELLVIPEQSRG